MKAVRDLSDHHLTALVPCFQHMFTEINRASAAVSAWHAVVFRNYKRVFEATRKLKLQVEVGLRFWV